jgi:putative alpha-1,2-mannosidase
MLIRRRLLTGVQYVPQDTAHLITLQGGKVEFIDRLNWIFDQVRLSHTPVRKADLPSELL